MTVEIGSAGGHVLLRITAPDGGAGVEVEMSPDEARQFSNSLGEAILRLSRAGVMAI